MLHIGPLKKSCLSVFCFIYFFSCKSKQLFIHFWTKWNISHQKIKSSIQQNVRAPHVRHYLTCDICSQITHMNISARQFVRSRLCLFFLFPALSEASDVCLLHKHGCLWSVDDVHDSWSANVRETWKASRSCERQLTVCGCLESSPRFLSYQIFFWYWHLWNICAEKVMTSI